MTMTDELVTEARKGGPCAELGDRCRAIEAASGCFCAAVADRIEQLTAERDRAYASGYSDAETEISKSALGQRNDFLHSQYANAADHIKVLTADNARLREALQVYANSCDATETSLCGYEEHTCCRTARAALNTGKEPSHD
jgi:hypothetical protein